MNDDAEIERQARNAQLCATVIELWKRGFDTNEIARLAMPSMLRARGEAVAYRILATWRDLPWQQRRVAS